MTSPRALLLAAADRVRDLAAAADKADVGVRIRVARVAAGLALREVARRVDCAPSYLSDIENGHRVPSAAVVTQLASELRLDAGLLLAAAGRVAATSRDLAPHLEEWLRYEAAEIESHEDTISPDWAPLRLARVLCPDLAKEKTP
jgi:transcriptional regulator with XRE-family HTH domain